MVINEFCCVSLYVHHGMRGGKALEMCVCILSKYLHLHKSLHNEMMSISSVDKYLCKVYGTYQKVFNIYPSEAS